jgi:conjugative transposon TraK protein
MNLIQNLEQKMKFSLILCLLCFITMIVAIGMSLSYASSMIAKDRKQIYVLSGSIPLIATQTSIENNREAEYIASVDLFHNYFFCLPPDNNFIELQLNKAMYLVDASGIAQYNTLKEHGYFSTLISSSSVVTLTKDSIVMKMENKTWIYYGKEKIERPSNITIRSLVTEGSLQDIPRTINNPHGVLITNWKTIENKDLSNETKKIF